MLVEAIRRRRPDEGPGEVREFTAHRRPTVPRREPGPPARVDDRAVTLATVEEFVADRDGRPSQLCTERRTTAASFGIVRSWPVSSAKRRRRFSTVLRWQYSCCATWPIVPHAA